MDLTTAKKIVESLANGIDPSTGELFPSESPYHHADIVRALFCLLKHTTAKTTKVKKSIEEKQEENLVRGLPKNSGFPWTDELKTLVAAEFKNGKSADSLAKTLERTKGSIVSELRKQGLITSEEAANLMGYAAPYKKTEPQTAT